MVYFKSAIVLEHVCIKIKKLIYTKISREKSFLTIYWKSMKKGKIKGYSTNLKLWDTYNFLEPKEKRATFTFNQKSM